MDDRVPGFVGVDEAARLLGISRLTFRRLIREHQLQIHTTPLDRRLKLVSLADVKRLRGSRQAATPALGQARP